MRFGAASDKGIQREVNEDSYLLTDAINGFKAIAIVADGMGGHNSGDVASRLAVDSVVEFINSQDPDDKDHIGVIKRAFEYANTKIFGLATIGDDNYGMGTTLIVAALTAYGELCAGHVGDSRLYIISGSVIRQITTDHSYIEELVQNGTLTREQADHHPQKNIITRAVGNQDTIETDLFCEKLKKGDKVMACTDGLTNMVNNDVISKVIGGAENPQKACEELIKIANENGGEDNITVVIFEV